MKKFHFLIFTISALISWSSCKKDKAIPTVGSLNIVNATADIPSLALNFSPAPFPYSTTQSFIADQSAMEFPLPTGANTLNLVSPADSTKNLYHGTLNLARGSIYSFYTSGQSGSYQTLFMEDHIPIYPDSAAGARFINLSADSQPLNVVLQGNSSNEFSSLSYKSITAFKKYVATSSVVNNGGYNFNITDVSGNVLATFNWVPQVFNKSNTLVITGLVGNGTVSVFAVNDY